MWLNLKFRQLLELLVFRLCFLQDWSVRVRVFPEKLILLWI